MMEPRRKVRSWRVAVMLCDSGNDRLPTNTRPLLSGSEAALAILRSQDSRTNSSCRACHEVSRRNFHVIPIFRNPQSKRRDWRIPANGARRVCIGWIGRDREKTRSSRARRASPPKDACWPTRRRRATALRNDRHLIPPRAPVRVSPRDPTQAMTPGTLEPPGNLQNSPRN